MLCVDNPLPQAVEALVDEALELYSQRSRLFRYRGDMWEKKGLGEAQLLLHKRSGKVRFSPETGENNGDSRQLHSTS